MDTPKIELLKPGQKDNGDMWAVSRDGQIIAWFERSTDAIMFAWHKHAEVTAS